MRGFKKDDVQFHNADTIGGPYYPAVNVKHYRLDLDVEDVMEKFGCSELTASNALEYAYDMECNAFWDYWGSSVFDESAKYFPDEQIEVYSAGRSSGWLIVGGLPDVEDWDAVMLNRWAIFERDVKEDVKYRLSKETLLEDIEANRWAEEGAERYNFVHTKDGTKCVVDLARGEA